MKVVEKGLPPPLVDSFPPHRFVKDVTYQRVIDILTSQPLTTLVCYCEDTDCLIRAVSEDPHNPEIAKAIDDFKLSLIDPFAYPDVYVPVQRTSPSTGKIVPETFQPKGVAIGTKPV